MNTNTEKPKQKAGLLLQFSLAAGMCISATAWAANDEMELKTDADRESYAVGYQIGGDFLRQKMELNTAAVARGITDAHSGDAPLMSEQDMRATLIELKRKIMAQEHAAPLQIEKGDNNATPPEPAAAKPDAAAASSHARRGAAKMTPAATEFLKKNAKRDGIVTLASGLQYKVLKEGKGKQPKAADQVALIYRGSFVNGNEFGNTDKDGKAVPRVFPVSALVPGMREAISQMKEGAQWQVFVPPQLGFDASTPLYRKITVFDVQLVAVNP
ncbi:MAG TPA: FKBP-type peptidyl-prolyl cis-trans isomerase N-terminal domain-containing protein [Sideroxyarcus sp.]|nr:FKBP-type peptidyl-prolyl cis-trans isomerase N-terminal domain-containing protein [Sideroxyarcus sp.]